ncbi:hypothetical protein K6119_12595 [Paracrocinitomix mangrovi]|uniref:hypothetical protein n=1 Tax=Paracrocinitomix mangrovi TaxID=2862509 RepID=UPI001C8E3B3B|nr:hypothetical protein [Paracrocinitomix mangrovi]UKN00569.1 hypothetical protein K6119_12595 [Paracrocinitomix mangrovi]
MLSDILYWTLNVFYLIAIVFVVMIPFFFYLYWLNNKQNRYFKKLGSELGLEYKSLGNKIKRDFPELNGTINGVRCFIGASRTKGRYGSSAQTRNHYPIILIQAAVNVRLQKLILQISPKEIKHEASPTIGLKADTLTKLQHFAQKHGGFVIQQSKEGVIQTTLLNELSNKKQYDKVSELMPIFIQLAKDINAN